MKSQGSPSFCKCYYDLPKEIRRQAVKTHRMWRDPPEAGGLQFKSYRVLGLLEDDTMYWLWIGKHDEYGRILKEV